MGNHRRTCYLVWGLTWYFLGFYKEFNTRFKKDPDISAQHTIPLSKDITALDNDGLPEREQKKQQAVNYQINQLNTPEQS